MYNTDDRKDPNILNKRLGSLEEVITEISMVPDLKDFLRRLNVIQGAVFDEIDKRRGGES